MANIGQAPRIAVVGAGGVGGYLGGMLSSSGLDVTFVSRPESAEVLRTKGLILRTVEKEFVLPPMKAVSSVAELRDVDVVLLTTKSYDLEASLANLPESIRRTSALVTFQNGIDADKKVREQYPDAEVYPGVAYIISTKKGPGVVEQSAGPRKFIVGDRAATDNPCLKDLALVMRDAGIDCTYSPQIEREMWVKFIWILAFAGVTGTCRSSIGPIVNDPHGMAMFVRCVDEAIAVARALCVDVTESDRATVISKAEGYKTKGVGAKASLLVDLEAGRPTEVEALHGALVRIAKEVNIPVPTIETMYGALRIPR